MEFFIGGMAAMSAGFFTNPLEVVKHHMEMDKKSSEINKSLGNKYRGFFGTGLQIAKNEGIKSLQKGLSPVMGYHLVSYGMKLGTYQFGQNRGFTTDTQGNVMVPKSVLTSGVGGLLGQYFSSPFYLIKVQHEIDQMHPKGENREKKEGYMNTIKNIYREHGIRGFFRGATASLPRAFIGTSQLTSFAVAKEGLNQLEAFQQHPLLSTVLASTVAGIVLTMCMTPFDMVLTKLYKQAIAPAKTGVQYRGFLDCMRKTYMSNGFKPFYRGMGPLYLKLGPHTVLCLLFWEEFKDLYNTQNVNNDTSSFYKKFGFVDNSYEKYGSYNKTFYDLDDLSVGDINMNHKCDTYWN